MALALPGSRNIFSQLKNALFAKKGSQAALCKGVHDALDDFWWIHENVASRPTHIAELVPLALSAEGHHDASSVGDGGVWFPGTHLA